MILPYKLQAALNNELSSISHEELIKAAQDISLRYRSRDRQPGKHFIQNRNEALAYAVSRMPATFGAVYSALDYTLDSMEPPLQDIKSLIDVGAGTGSAAWAAGELLDLDSIICIENNEYMKNLGHALMSCNPDLSSITKWKSSNIVTENLPGKADLVIASYVLNELSEGEQQEIADKLWAIADKILLIVETGTPEGYRVISRIRTRLLKYDARILAPCPHNDACPVTGGDWCHFACRVQRCRLHRMAKGGKAPFEDEKFSYLAITKKTTQTDYVRILRHPVIGKGHVRLEVCAKDGIRQITISKRNGDIYKIAKKANCGDKIKMP